MFYKTTFDVSVKGGGYLKFYRSNFYYWNIFVLQYAYIKYNYINIYWAFRLIDYIFD